MYQFTGAQTLKIYLEEAQSTNIRNILQTRQDMIYVNADFIH
jgi:hypothetical protein